MALSSGSQAWQGTGTTGDMILETNLDSQVHSTGLEWGPVHSTFCMCFHVGTKVTGSEKRHWLFSLVFHSDNLGTCLVQVPKPIRSSNPSFFLENPNWTTSKHIAWELTTCMRTQRILKSNVGSWDSWGQVKK